MICFSPPTNYNIHLQLAHGRKKVSAPGCDDVPETSKDAGKTLIVTITEEDVFHPVSDAISEFDFFKSSSNPVYSVFISYIILFYVQGSPVPEVSEKEEAFFLVGDNRICTESWSTARYPGVDAFSDVWEKQENDGNEEDA